jgi:hypothetical protein
LHSSGRAAWCTIFFDVSERAATRPIHRARGLLVPAAGILLLLQGCDLDERLKTCRDLRLELVNALPSEGAIHIAADGEGFSSQTLLAAVPGGSSRSLTTCVEKGDRRRFRAGQGDRVVAVATCVVSLTANDLEGATARVVWTSQGLLCEGW